MVDRFDRLGSSDTIRQIDTGVISCRRCPRLVAWREEVARNKRAAYSHEDYWGRPVPGFGHLAARLLVERMFDRVWARAKNLIREG